jgi:circadian clock protein KaiC
MNQITEIFTNLTGGDAAQEATDIGISSVMDTWLLVRDIELGGERNRAMYVLKSRGMAHSNQVREFLMTTKGIKLVPAYLGASGVLTGSARLSQEARDSAELQLAREELERKQLALDHRRKAIEAQVEALRAQFKAEEEEFARVSLAAQMKADVLVADRGAMANSRRARGNNSRRAK